MRASTYIETLGITWNALRSQASLRRRSSGAPTLRVGVPSADTCTSASPAPRPRRPRPPARRPGRALGRPARRRGPSPSRDAGACRRAWPAHWRRPARAWRRGSARWLSASAGSTTPTVNTSSARAARGVSDAQPTAAREPRKARRADPVSGHARTRSNRRAPGPAHRSSSASRPHARPAPAPMKITIDVTRRRWKPCWPKLHPLARQPEVHGKIEADERGEPRQEAERETDPDGHLAPDLERGKERRVGQDGLLEEVLVPADRVPGCEFRHPLRVEPDEAGDTVGYGSTPQASPRASLVHTALRNHAPATTRSSAIQASGASMCAGSVRDRHVLGKRAGAPEHFASEVRPQRLNRLNSHCPRRPSSGGTSSAGMQRASVSGQPSSGAS